ncbi:Midasin [Hondaea fermentalgiana]|uniref:Midasin n=1 Tax=Hondaea fermentalgiana TaxID=2315210 RepID=A0A2R5GN05_9STRA|nr:Midasin [Hondaea fermentalgiana]|eukprot:GBG32276.1 Midasin [Hondaea fermentalgiana]
MPCHDGPHRAAPRHARTRAAPHVTSNGQPGIQHEREGPNWNRADDTNHAGEILSENVAGRLGEASGDAGLEKETRAAVESLGKLVRRKGERACRKQIVEVLAAVAEAVRVNDACVPVALDLVTGEELGHVDVLAAAENAQDRIAVCRACELLFTSAAGAAFVASRSWEPLYALVLDQNDLVRAHASRAVRELLGLPLGAHGAKLQKATTAARDAAALAPPPVRIQRDLEHLLLQYQEQQTSEVDANVAMNVSNETPGNNSISEAIERHWAKDGSARAVRSATTESNLRAAMVALRNGAPVLLEGRSGAGKSLLVQELARMHGKESTLVELQLDDQMDSKTLLGTYVCTDVPGEFRWQPGALTQAVLNGCWVFIEDIDRAPFEVLAALIPLFESRQLLLPNRDQVIAAGPGFQLLATRRSAVRGPPLLERLWTSVHVRPLPPKELLAVAKELYADLSPSLLALILRTFQCIVQDVGSGKLRDGKVDSSSKIGKEESENKMEIETPEDEGDQDEILPLPVDPKRVIPGRTMSERDLFKWLRRIGALVKLHARERASKSGGGIFLTEQEREDLLVEAMDCFVAAMPSVESRISMAQWLAAIWHLPKERILHRIRSYKPEVVPRGRSDPSLRVGRARLLMSAREDAQRPGRVAATGVSMRLLEQIACSVQMNEPVLLVGETGAGKTSMVQHLARLLGKKLVVQNMHVQSDTTELLGGFKPVQLRHVAMPLYARFTQLFCETFAESANQRFLQAVEDAVAKSNWKKLGKACVAACKMADAKWTKQRKALEADEEAPRKRRRRGRSNEGGNEADDAEASGDDLEMDARELAEREAIWEDFRAEVYRFERQRKRVENSFAFSFEEGALVKAIRAGDWVLLDEINLASGETLERLSALLDDEDGTLSLTERGDLERVERHPDFRIFAAMNPATDVGKRDLPPALRSRFTELFVDEVEDAADLQLVVGLYLDDIPNPPVHEIVDLYLTARKRANEQTLLDGANQPPRYSLRTLCRALLTTRVLLTKGFGLARALYESFVMTFATLLNEKSLKAMSKLLKKTFVADVSVKALESAPRCPGTKSTRNNYILCDKFWLLKGPRLTRPAADAMPESSPAAEALKLEAAAEDRAAASLISSFVETPLVLRNIQALARAIAAQKYPVLLQGPTSSGKTTMVSYLAAKAGYKCVRINNHEHTDLQEYMGSYVSDERGNLVFREGALVEAVRNGYWIVLDELNLAPSEVLEALNRLLDDNREVFIPETQEVVKPHPNFMLFATQNPPGLYGGRKMLSRAFRNRFLELHVGEIPTKELETILNKRCALAPTFCKVLVNVMTDLQMHRQQSKLFAGKEGFITPRDLLRWANRNPTTYEELAVEGFRLLGDRVRSDADKRIVQDVIEKRCKTQLTDALLYPAGEGTAFAGCSGERAQAEGVSKVVPTRAMRRTYALVRRCLEVKEPALLIGETGCGKTTVCQMLAIEADLALQILNCHQNTDTADILGSLRPMRNKNQLQTRAWELASAHGWDRDSCASLDELESRATSRVNSLADASEDSRASLQEIISLVRRYRALFEWQDGPLIDSMRKGDMFLLDELSLAEDAVLERLNSVLEPSRTLFLAERGGDQVEEIVAHDTFRILATMNPGGDYGKRELSPALRNRFTEIWIPPVHDEADLVLILQRHLNAVAASAGMKDAEARSALAQALATFYTWFNGPAQNDHALIQLTLRDLISWAAFMVHVTQTANIEPWTAFLHGAGLVLLDGLGLGSGVSEESCRSLRAKSCAFLLELVPLDTQVAVREKGDLLLRSFFVENTRDAPMMRKLGPSGDMSVSVVVSDEAIVHMSTEEDLDSRFGLHPFYISRGPVGDTLSGPDGVGYALDAPTTSENLARVLRAMQLERPILLEGSPGVGKTSLIDSLAKRSGHRLVRINLSEQTDFADLIGSDIPAAANSTEEGAVADKVSSGAKFTWSDGVFLAALKAGDWVLLDELNLASQSVLEGLNACLDHRGTVYVPELNQSFHCPPSFRVFAAQNPVQQGGGRKGLPKSFLNRFTKVFVQQLTDEDYGFIVSKMYPEMDRALADRLIAFNSSIVHDTIKTMKYARAGAPWEFNLRDIFRLCELCAGAVDMEAAIVRHAGLVYFDRLRTEEDREKMRAAFAEHFGAAWSQRRIELRTSRTSLSVGAASVARSPYTSNQRTACDEAELPTGFIPRSALPTVEHIAHCVDKQWPVLLLGASGTGKTSILRAFAQLCGRRLHEFAVTSSTDSTELLGCFEQVDLDRKVRELRTGLTAVCCNTLRHLVVLGDESMNADALQRAETLEAHRHLLVHGPELLPRAELDAMFADLGEVVDESNPYGLEPLHLEVYRSDLSRLKTEWEAELAASKSGSLLGAFEWVDGTLVRAMERGDWVVLNNANLCNPTVLDRLNPVLEMGGELMINECGMVNGKPRIIRPHKDFRIFLVADPAFGEVSRAMRNRCVEIALLSPSWGATLASGDAERALAHLGISSQAAMCMLGAFSVLAESSERACTEVATPSSLVRWAKMYRTFDSFSVCGSRPDEALRLSFEACFDVTMPWDATVARAAGNIPDSTLALNTSRFPWACAPILGDGDARLLGVLQSGAALAQTLQYATLASETRTVESNDDKSKASAARAAIAHFIHAASSSDWSLRTAFAQATSQEASDLVVAVQERYNNLVASMEKDTSIPSVLEPQTFDACLVDEPAVAQGHIVRLLVSLWIRSHIAEAKLPKLGSGDGAGSAIMENVQSLLDAVELCDRGKLSKADLRVPGAAVLPVLLRSLEKFVQAASTSLLGQCDRVDADVRDALLMQLRDVVEIHANMVRILCQVHVESADLFESLVKVVDLSRRSWLQDAATSFRDALESGHLALLMTAAQRHTLVDAACAIRWANAQRASSSDALEESAAAVDGIVQRISRTLEGKQTLVQRANTEYKMLGAVDTWSLMSAEDMSQLADPELSKSLHGQAPEASRGWGFVQLQPLMDAWACRALLHLCAEAFSRNEDGTPGAFDVQSAEDTLGYALEASSLPPHLIVPFKELALRRDAGAPCENLELDLLHGLYEAISGATFNSRESIDADASAHIREDLAKFMFKRKAWTPFVEIDVFADTLSAGMPRLVQDVASLVIFRVVRGSGVGMDRNQPRDRSTTPFGETVSIRDRAMRLGQLQILFAHLLSETTFAEKSDGKAAARQSKVAEVLGDERRLFARELLSTLRVICSFSASLDLLESRILGKSFADDGEAVFGALLDVLDEKLGALGSHLVDCTLRSALSTLRSGVARQDIALASTMLALFRLHVLSPNSAVDPCLKPQVRLLRAEGARREIVRELEVRRENDCVTGRAFGPLAHAHEGLLARDGALQEEIVQLHEQVVHRPSSGEAGFPALHAAVFEFNTSIGAVDRVLGIVRAVQMRAQDADMQEDMLLEACRQLCASLDRDFQGYEDVVRPVQVSLRRLQHGLRVLGVEARRGSEAARRAEKLSEVRRVLGAFPSTAVGIADTRFGNPLDALQSTLVETRDMVSKRTWTRMLEAVFARASALLQARQSQNRKNRGGENEPKLGASDAWSTLSNILAAFTEEFLTEKRERKVREEEANQTFKYKTREHLAAGTPEAIKAQEEASFREMFPDFHEEFDRVAKKVLEDLDELAVGDDQDMGNDGNGSDEEGENADGDDENSAARLEGLDHKSYVAIVDRVVSLLLMGSSMRNRGTTAPQPLFRVAEAYLGVGYHAAGIFADPLELGVDENRGGILGAHVLALALGAQDCQRRVKLAPLADEPQDVTVDLGEVVPVKKNLNQDSFVEEVALLEVPLIQLSAKLDELLASWPDNAPLLQLAKLTMRLRELPLTCPLMRALVGIETLLRIANDWEMVAHKDVSIRGFTAPFVRLVVRWRKLELRSWPYLLEQRARASQDEAKLWFYETYSLVTGELESAEVADVLFSTMDQFARTATLGCFETRLRMLGALGELLRCKREAREADGDAGSADESLTVMEHQFWHLERYYAQWIADIRATADRQRVPIKQKLKDQVKLAKWDDRNYYALKVSAEKTHRLLHKLSGDVDEILAQPSYQTIEHVLDSRVGKRTEPRSGEGEAILVEMDDIDTARLPAVGKLSLASVKASPSEARGENVSGSFMDTPGGYGLRLPKLATKTEMIARKVVARALSSEAWRQDLTRAAAMNEAVIDRIKSLRTGKAPQSAKQRAVVDFFRALREEGLSQARADNAMLFAAIGEEEQKNSGTSLKLFSMRPIVVQDLEKIGMPSSATALFARSDRDFYKDLAQLQRLRVNIVSGALSADLPRMQMQRGLRFCEHAMEIMVDQREALALHVDGRLALRQAAADLARVAQSSARLDEAGVEFHVRLVEMLQALQGNAEELADFLRVLAAQPGADEVSAYLRARGASSMLGKLSTLSDLRSHAEGDGAVAVRTLADRVARALALVSPGLGHLCLTHDETKHLEELPEVLRDVQSAISDLSVGLEHVGLPSQVLREVVAHVRELVATGDDFGASLLSASSLASTHEQGQAQRAAKSQEDDKEKASRQSPQSQQTAPASVDEVVELALVIMQDVRSELLPFTETSGELQASGIVAQHQRQLALLKSTRVTQLATRVGAASRDCLTALCDGGLDEHSSRGLRALVELASNFVGQVEATVRALEVQSVEFLAHLGRFEFLMLRVFRSLASNGFCKPPDEEEEGEGEDAEAFGEGEGTGMGEGKGREDVTDEIEDEEQLLGQKKEQEDGDQDKKEEEKPDERKGDDGMEMENEFEGDIFDVEDPEQKEDQEENNEDDEEELDREMGDLDREDEHVVDEKLWNEDDEDSEDEGKDDEPESFEKDAPMQGDDGNDELRAKEEDEEDDKDKQEPKEKPDDAQDRNKQDPKGDKDEDEAEGPDRVDEADNVEERNMDVAQDEDEDVTGEDAEEQVLPDDRNDEVEDLPEDMQIDEDEDEEKAGADEGEDGAMDVDGALSDGADEDGEDKEEEDAEADAEAKDDDAGQNDAEENDREQADQDRTENQGQEEVDDDEGDKGDEEDKDEEKEDEDPSEKPVQLPEQAAEDEDDKMEDRAFGTDAPKAGENDDEADQDKQDAAQSAAQHAEDAEDQDESESKEKDPGQQSSSRGKPQDEGDASREDWVKDESQLDEDRDGDEGQDQDQDKDQQQARERPNPWRDAGSALEHWHRRLSMLADEGKDKNDKDDGEDSDAGLDDANHQDEEKGKEQDADADDRAYEFSDSKAEATTQVLAPSAQDTTDEAGLPPEDEDEGQDEKEDEGKTGEDAMEEENDERENQGEGKRKMTDEDDEDDEDEDADGNDDKNDDDAKDDNEAQSSKPRKKRQRTGLEVDGETEENSEKARDGDQDGHSDDEKDNEVDEDDLGHVIETDKDLPAQVAEARGALADARRKDYDAAEDDEDAFGRAVKLEELSEADRERWGRLAGDTNESSQRLCEQLRLLLEPTLASKLRGDYRTGKRINMRRVIPYIASQFRKDKIWLRRTKPSKREYQVLLAIDDSKSMAMCGDLALTALVTISKALTKLEVGQVGVVSFGDGVDMVHDLSQPFSDNSGASIVSQVKFDQEKTSIEEGLQVILRRFERARDDLGAVHASASGQTTEFRQLAFFISDGRFDSAARERVKRMVREAMAQRVLIVLVIVEFAGQESILTTRQASFVKGKVKMSNYLDDYPFPLYVILKDMESLPEVLADGLRQWFELLSSRE